MKIPCTLLFFRLAAVTLGATMFPPVLSAADGAAQAATDRSARTIPGNLYVSARYGSDRNPGTARLPFKSIQRAANLARAGTTIHVGPGTYAEALLSAANGTASARIRYRSVDKWKARIVPAGTTLTMWTVTGSHTDIDGFEIDGSGGTSVRAGVYLNGGNSSVRNSWVHHVAQNSGCDNQGGAALVADQHRGRAFGNYDFVANLVHDIGASCGWIQGIYHSSSGTIVNNIVHGTNTAINMGHDDHNLQVLNNTLFANRGYAVYFGACQEAYNQGCPTRGIRVHNNIIYNNMGGIQGPVEAEDVGNDVRNNLVYANRNDFDLAPPSKSTLVNIIQADPQFVRYAAVGGGDYRLRASSPALDSALGRYLPASDIGGQVRGESKTMGAHAYRTIRQRGTLLDHNPWSANGR